MDSTQSLVPGLYGRTSPWYKLNCTDGGCRICPPPDSRNPNSVRAWNHPDVFYCSYSVSSAGRHTSAESESGGRFFFEPLSLEFTGQHCFEVQDVSGSKPSGLPRAQEASELGAERRWRCRRRGVSRLDQGLAKACAGTKIDNVTGDTGARSSTIYHDAYKILAAKIFDFVSCRPASNSLVCQVSMRRAVHQHHFSRRSRPRSRHLVAEDHSEARRPPAQTLVP